jgi:hypothetical protein
MAYLLTHFWPGATVDEYKASIAAVHPPGGLPEGQTYHAAGPTDGGIIIAAVWESKEQSDRFVQDTLLPSMPVGGGLYGRAGGARSRDRESRHTRLEPAWR